MLQTAHLALGWALGAIALGVCAIAVAGAVRPPMTRRWLDRAVLAGTGASLLAALAGAATWLTGGGPKDPLHVLYAAVAVLCLPIARAWGEAGPRPAPMLLGGVILLGVTLRLFQTG